MRKRNIAVVTGGLSGEYDISIQSAQMVFKHLATAGFNPYTILIRSDGWHLEYENRCYTVDKNDFTVELNSQHLAFDCAFMALHGTPAEDGKLPAYFDMIGLPYTCCGPSVSALTFNKGFTTAFLKHAGLHTAASVIIRDAGEAETGRIIEKTGLPCFVKPNEGGSSIGITKVSKITDLKPAIERAFAVDDSVMIEQSIEGTEITCGVAMLGKQPRAIAVTEIVTRNEFFDYRAKYQDEATREITPARIKAEHMQACKETSERIYKILGCRGIIRIDYILTKEKLYLIEINTIPGLSEMSIVPKMASQAGISLSELFSEQIHAVMPIN